MHSSHARRLTALERMRMVGDCSQLLLLREAAPGTLTPDDLASLIDAGRLTIDSLDDAELNLLAGGTMRQLSDAELQAIVDKGRRL